MQDIENNMDELFHKAAAEISRPVIVITRKGRYECARIPFDARSRTFSE